MSKKPETFEFRKPSKSYEEMRRAGTKGDRPLRASVVTPQKPGDDTTTDEPAPASAAPPLTAVRTREEPEQTTWDNFAAAPNPTLCDENGGPEEAVEEPAEEPTPEFPEQPARECPLETDTADEAPQEVVQKKKPVEPQSRKPASRPERKLPDRMVRLENGAVQMHGYVYCPLPGRFAEFDKLVTAYGARKAMGLAIDFGLEMLQQRIAASGPVEPILGYATEKKRSRFRRNVNPDVFEWATETLDPANVLTHHAFAGQLWKTALGLYLAKG